MSSAKATIRAFEHNPAPDIASRLAIGRQARDTRYRLASVSPSQREIAR